MNKKIIFKIIIAAFSIVLLLAVKQIPQSIDSTFSSIFTKITGERHPDSSIIIIHISSDDIEQLGPWPIKRSYYALLIDNLTTLKVKKIGLEVFLSAKFASQSLYDNLLQKEIRKNANVVLSSLAGNIIENNLGFVTDSLSYPSPKLIDESIATGHINYIKDHKIIIPLKLKSENNTESAFCLELFSKRKDYPDEIKINFVSSWKKFQNYSLLEFFDLVRNNDVRLKDFKNKIILIGISDPQLSSTFETNFDDQLPGVALHAFALDNLLDKRYFNDDYYSLSVLTFIILAFIWIIVFKKNVNPVKNYFVIVIPFLIISYLLHQFYYLELGFAFFLVPVTFVLISDLYFKFLERRNEYKGAVDEARLLKNLLEGKEKELAELQKELNYSSQENSDSLLTKIKELKGDIEKLKDSEEDRKPVEIKSEIDEVNFFGLVYRSKEMQSVTEIIKKAAPTDATILITGESGTGKELVANAIHSLSKRKNEKLIAVNCAALTETLLESELFGHVKGAFTGAVTDKIGKFEAADKGTIFLDEIGETSENFQVKLLRILQSGEFDKVGSVVTSKVDVRVISATNKDLKQLVKEKKFREDLYYRLNVINIHIPPLRDRKQDIESIANYLLKSDGGNVRLSMAVLKALTEYDWKGNVRELESVIKRALVFCKSAERNLLQLNDLPDDLVKNIKFNFEDLVIESLRQKNFSHSSINETAKELGNVSRTLVAENFRGYSFRILVEKNFNLSDTARFISASGDLETINRVQSKLETWLNNIKKDVLPNKSDDFEKIKNQLISKYKNLPQKFHIYLDEVIKYYLRN